jgi:hypothetical protein
MTTAVAEERAGAAPARGLAERRQPPTMHSATRPVAREVAPGSEPSTLEDALLCAWEDLAARGRAECLVCGGALRSDGDVAECGHCGSALG